MMDKEIKAAHDWAHYPLGWHIEGAVRRVTDAVGTEKGGALVSAMAGDLKIVLLALSIAQSERRGALERVASLRLLLENPPPPAAEG